jgi:sugar phosphate isomerase/epimerase
MLTRREFLGKAFAGAGASAAIARSQAWAAGELAWPKPIGLELYTVRELFAEDPARTLKQVAAIGYKEVEFSPHINPAVLRRDLRTAGLNAPSSYFDVPKTLEDWKAAVSEARSYGVRYVVVGDNPQLSAQAWRRRADFFNQCGEISLSAGIQFCYHAHFHEFERVDGATGYDILLAHCEPRLLKMEMDIFWVMYAGANPLHYWQRYPGRFPLLHVKDLRKGVRIDPHAGPEDHGPNPFAPVGQGTIDWPKLFAHVREAGVKHIFVEQDRCNLPPLGAAKISFNYLKNLGLS